MLLLRALLGLILLALWVYCIVDVLTRHKSEHRALPKLVWLAIVVLLPEIGSVLWLLVGRPRGAEIGADRPNRGTAGVPASPDDDEAYLRALRERAEQQRRAAERQRRAAEERRRQEENRPEQPED